MLPNDLSQKVIRKLREIETRLHNVDVHIPSQDEQIADLEIIKNKFTGSVYRPYVRHIEIAYHYATTHFHRNTGNSMFDDIVSDKRIVIADYYKT